MSSVDTAVRRLIARQVDHPVVSLYLDLDPERFATPPARASLIRSLLDEAHARGRAAEASATTTAGAARGSRADRGFFPRAEAPFQGHAGAGDLLLVRDDLFEVVQLTRPVAGSRG